MDKSDIMFDQAITAVVIGVVVYFMVEQVHGGPSGPSNGPSSSDSKAVGTYALIIGIVLLVLQKSSLDLTDILGDGRGESHVSSFQNLLLLSLTMNLFTWVHFSGFTTKQCLSVLTDTPDVTHSVQMQSETSTGPGPICSPAFVQANAKSNVSIPRHRDTRAIPPPPMEEPPKMITVHIKRNEVNEDITMEKPASRRPPVPTPKPSVETRLTVDTHSESDDVSVNTHTEVVVSGSDVGRRPRPRRLQPRAPRRPPVPPPKPSVETRLTVDTHSESDDVSVNTRTEVVISGADVGRRPRPRQRPRRQQPRSDQSYDTISSKAHVRIQSGPDGKSFSLDGIVHLNVEELNALADENKFRYDVFLNSTSVTTSEEDEESELPGIDYGAAVSVSSSSMDGESEIHSDVQVDVHSGRQSPCEEVIYFEPVPNRRPKNNNSKWMEPSDSGMQLSNPLSICTQCITYVMDCRPSPRPPKSPPHKKRRRRNHVSGVHQVSQPKATRSYEPCNDNDSSISVEAEVTRYQGPKERKAGRRMYDDDGDDDDDDDDDDDVDDDSSIAVEAEVTYQGPRQRKAGQRACDDDSSSLSVEAEVTYQCPRQPKAGRRTHGDDFSSISIEAEVTSSRYQGPRQSEGRRGMLFSALDNPQIHILKVDGRESRKKKKRKGHPNPQVHILNAPLGDGRGGKKTKKQKGHPNQRKPAAKGDYHHKRNALRKHPRGTSLMVQGNEGRNQCKGLLAEGNGTKIKPKVLTKQVPTSGQKFGTNFFFKLVLLGAILFSLYNISSEVLDAYPALKNAAGHGSMNSVPLLLLTAGAGSAVVFGLFSSRGKLKRKKAGS